MKQLAKERGHSAVMETTKKTMKTKNSSTSSGPTNEKRKKVAFLFQQNDSTNITTSSTIDDSTSSVLSDEDSDDTTLSYDGETKVYMRNLVDALSDLFCLEYVPQDIDTIADPIIGRLVRGSPTNYDKILPRSGNSGGKKRMVRGLRKQKLRKGQVLSASSAAYTEESEIFIGKLLPVQRQEAYLNGKIVVLKRK